MPVLPSAKIALRKDRRRTVVNTRVKNIMKLSVRAVRDSKDPETLPKAYQAIDRAVKKNLLHQKKASRLKSQLSKLVERPGSKKKDTKKTDKPAKKASKTKATKKTTKKTTKKKATSKAKKK